MFGSLVVVFPTPHEGGALFLRHHGHEWIFDSSRVLAAVKQPTIGYVAFFSDIEHEVAPVTSGNRTTLTYNLYFGDGPVSEKVSRHLIPPQLPNREGFLEAFKALLENPEFMADGGTLTFGLRHVYPINKSLEHLHKVLKGSDAIVYEGMHALGFDPVLYVYYEQDYPNPDAPQGAMVDKVVKFKRVCYEEGTVLSAVQDEGGIPVVQHGVKVDIDDLECPELVEWVTPATKFNRQEGAFASYSDEPALNLAFGDVCMVVRIGKAGDRLAYPTAAEVKREYLRL